MTLKLRWRPPDKPPDKKKIGTTSRSTPALADPPANRNTRSSPPDSPQNPYALSVRKARWTHDG